MRKIREVLRLRWECKVPYRTIARSCTVGHSAAQECVCRAELAGLSWPLPEDLDDAALAALLYPGAQGGSSAIERALPDWAYVFTELRRKEMTLRLLWVEYREHDPQGYSYSQYCELYNRWAGHLRPSLRLIHRAGEKCFVDYAGQTIEVIDPDTGEIREAQLFVGVLGASSYTYAEAHWTQELPNWIAAHVRMSAFFQGVTEIWVPDNLKSGVTKPCRYEPGINPTYQDLARHYGVAVVPARVKKAKDKAKAEVAVQVVQRWILARLRNMQFFGLPSVNHTIGELLDEVNRRPMRHVGKSRRELFEALDRPALRPLPSKPYEMAVFAKATVGIDYHVGFDKNFYSVPFPLIRQEAWVRATDHTVEVFVRGKRVSSHRRHYTINQWYTLSEHRPPQHRNYLEWTPERFLRWAEKFGPATRQLVQTRLDSKDHPEQSFRACLGILGLAKRYGDARLEAACARALRSGIRSYHGIKNILDSGVDRLALHEESNAAPTASHANVRGKTYYR
jgi:transposase